jgi:signal transduction histidine kinase
LNNVSKHAQAKGVGVILERRDSTLSLIIEDDGRGFDTSKPEMTDGKKLGLTGMRERAALVGGTVDIESSAGDGTTVFVRIPVKLDAGGRANGLPVRKDERRQK